MRPICQGTQLIDFLVTRGVVKSNWSDYLDTLSSMKASLMDEVTLVKDIEARAWLRSHGGNISYPDLIELIRLLTTGEDGKETKLWVLGGGYKSDVVNGWLAVVKFYDDYRLDLVELGRKLRKTIVGISDAKKQIVEKRRQLVEISEKQSEHEATLAANVSKLATLMDQYRISDAKKDVTHKVQEFYDLQRSDQLHALRLKLESQLFDDARRRYSDQFGLSTQQALFASLTRERWGSGDFFNFQVVAEELLHYYRNSEPVNEAICDYLSAILADVAESASSETHAKGASDAAEIIRLRKRIRNDGAGSKWTAREEECRDALVELEQELEKLRSRREVLRERGQAELDKIFIEGVDLVVPSD